MNRYYKQIPTFCTSSDSSLSNGDCQEDSDCLSKDSDFDGTFSICSSASLEDLSALAPILYNCIKQEPTIAPSLEAFIYSRSHSIVKQPATFIALLALIDHY